MKELIRKLVECYGPSGNETRVRDLIADEVRDLVDNLRTDIMGNLIASRTGEGPKLMLTAHMDELGIVVTHIDEKGFLRFGRLGGVNHLVLPGHRVIFADATIGVIGWEKREPARGEVKLEKLYIDVGAANKGAAKELVNIGDVAVLVGELAEAHGRYVAKALDDRVGCAILVEVLRQTKGLERNLVCVFTVQEEVGTRGAATAAFAVEPDMAIAVDVTAVGDTPESPPLAVSLGAGPAIKLKDYGMLAHPRVKKLLLDTATSLGLPHQLEVMEHGTTDAAAIQVSRSGVPTGGVSIPCRYIHTSAEMVEPTDVQNAVNLLVGVVERIKDVDQPY